MPGDVRSISGAPTNGLEPLAVGVFGGVSAFPLRLALERGIFVRHGLDVTVSLTPSSDALAASLLADDVQVVHAAPDNFVAWSDRTGEPVVAWIGGSNGPIALVARAGRELPGLRAARVGVDAPTSGFAPILRRILASGGVDVGAVELVELGATRNRVVALMDGSIDATMLSLPWSAMAVRDSAHVLADHTSVAPGLLTSAAGSRRAWLEANGPIADRYLAALVEALAILADPAERSANIAAMAADLGVDERLAGEILDLMLGPAGWPRDGAVSVAGMGVVCELRAEVVSAPGGSPETYLDLDPVARRSGGRP